MTSKLKCPFCLTELEQMHDKKMFGCPKCLHIADGAFWAKVIQEKKQFDRAIWWLKEIVKNHRYTPITTAEMALKELDDEQQIQI